MDYEIQFNFKAQVNWKEAPENFAEEVLREQVNNRIQLHTAHLEASIEGYFQELFSMIETPHEP